MTRKSLDDWQAELFASGQGETHPRGAQQRLLESLRRDASERASRRSTFRRGSALGGLLLAAIVLAGAFVLVREASTPDDEVDIVAEQVLPTKPPASAPAESPKPRSSVERVQPVAPEPPAPVPGQRQVAPQRAAPSLAEELATLKRARQALDAGDAARTLSELDDYDRKLGGRALRDEATLLRIQALSRSGRAAEAAQLARRFVAEHPHSPLVDRASSFVSAVEDPDTSDE